MKNTFRILFQSEKLLLSKNFAHKLYFQKDIEAILVYYYMYSTFVHIQFVWY